ncbi:MAG: hypothetical protein H6720_28700 [Sandaracinus sp.]|nr:hypothetical protein [Sandaracinus sp.]
MLRFVRASALVVALVSGCSHSPSVPVDAGPLPDGATEATRRLELDTPRALALRTGEEASIVVRYLDAEGRALSGESVRFVLDGVAHDTTLARIDDRADATGRAEATLVAGATAAAFRVRVSAELATPVSIDVAVSDAGFGELEVELDYAGDREDGVLAAAVFAGGDCEEARALSERGDRYRLRGPDDDVVRFVALPADLTYAVVGRLEGSTNAVGWGCVDGVTVSPEAPSRVRIEVDDLPLVVDGDYDATLAFDAPITAEATADELRAFGAAFLSPDPTRSCSTRWSGSCSRWATRRASTPWRSHVKRTSSFVTRRRSSPRTSDRRPRSTPSRRWSSRGSLAWSSAARSRSSTAKPRCVSFECARARTT